jgi:hypothetical protein
MFFFTRPSYKTSMEEAFLTTFWIYQKTRKSWREPGDEAERDE